MVMAPYIISNESFDDVVEIGKIHPIKYMNFSARIAQLKTTLNTDCIIEIPEKTIQLPLFTQSEYMLMCLTISDTAQIIVH